MSLRADAQSQSFLDHMDMFNANYHGAFAPADAVRSGSDPARLSRGDHDLGLSDARPAGCCHMAAPGSAPAIWNRQALEQLLGSISTPEMARLDSDHLLDRYGTVEAVLEAAIDNPENSAAHRLIASVHRFVCDRSSMALRSLPDLTSAEKVCECLRVSMAHEPLEQLRVLYLDSANRLILDKVHGCGTAAGIRFAPKEAIRMALSSRASALIVAHNHPSGDLTPSNADIAFTRRLMGLAKMLDLVVHDHLIVAWTGCISLRSLGHMDAEP